MFEDVKLGSERRRYNNDPVLYYLYLVQFATPLCSQYTS